MTWPPLSTRHMPFSVQKLAYETRSQRAGETDLLGALQRRRLRVLRSGFAVLKTCRWRALPRPSDVQVYSIRSTNYIGSLIRLFLPFVRERLAPLLKSIIDVNPLKIRATFGYSTGPRRPGSMLVVGYRGIQECVEEYPPDAWVFRREYGVQQRPGGESISLLPQGVTCSTGHSVIRFLEQLRKDLAIASEPLALAATMRQAANRRSTSSEMTQRDRSPRGLPHEVPEPSTGG